MPPVLSSHGRGLTPDMSEEGGSARAASRTKVLDVAATPVLFGHGLGLTPGMSAGAA